MTAKLTYTEIRIQKCFVTDDSFLLCENCNATSKTANMFLLFENGAINAIHCYCEKHIAEHLEEYTKELINEYGIK